MTNIIKLRYTKDGEPHGREYSYLTPVPVEVGDLVEIETSGKPAKGIITQIEVPEKEIEPFKDKVKTILGKAKTKSTVEEAKELLGSLIEKQENQNIDEGISPCPRCGMYTLLHPAIKNALSRYANVYICSACGTEEALMDATGKEPLALNEWAMIIAIDNKK